MTLHNLKPTIYILVISCLCFSCEDFVEVDAPNNKIVREVVFQNDATAQSAMKGIYNQLFQSAFSNGQRNSVTVLSGLSGGIVKNIYDSNIERLQFEQHDIQPDNSGNLNIWSSAYNIIYMSNSLLEGLESSNELTPELKTQLQGEAYFIRAFCYFYLANLYSDVPLVLSTDYNQNQLATRTPIGAVYQQIIEDLILAEEQLSADYPDSDRTRVNSFTASALLARVFLFIEDWENAALYSGKVIQSSLYHLPEDLNEVFLANSQEAIWQISPIGGGGFTSHTNEGNMFIIDPVFSFLAGLELAPSFPELFDEVDKRYINWIGYNDNLDAFYAYKYKIRNSTEFPIEEYSMVMRLAEQYLIRSEAQAQLGNLSEAITDLDRIRTRAGLSPLAQNNPNLNQEGILNHIYLERQRELFTEWGHRWLDLKRTNKATEYFSSQNPFWETTDIWYPIPSEERMRNPNLSQNEGY
ncbi:MAG: RagB/SusD family nutrient uptake outer membrane protein [Zunongwangia sp.]|uniref:RagB/SusD family nutrient uptake outer membrane protein n=1 Tax=Zunongwangia sp. TaxID=1965325 RepID=UPI00324276BE